MIEEPFYETGCSLDPIETSDANADNDGDGISNLEESRRGTSGSRFSGVGQAHGDISKHLGTLVDEADDYTNSVNSVLYD